MVEQSNPSIDGIAEVNDRFHKALLKACNNPKLSDLLIGLVELPLQLGTFRHYTLGELRRSANQHSELVTAVAAKDGDWARSVMTSHILSARYTLLSAMAGLPVDEDVVP